MRLAKAWTAIDRLSVIWKSQVKLVTLVEGVLKAPF